MNTTQPRTNWTRNLARLGIVALAVAFTLLAYGPETAYGSAYTTVNIPSDTDDGTCNPFNIFVAGTGCTLREAINAANADPGLNTINFGQFFNAGIVLVISPTSALPAITDPVILDGTTAGAGRVAIDGVNTGSGVDGLRLDADGNTVRGLAIYNFDGSFESDGIHINSSNNVIENNYIGIDGGGSTAGLGNGNGIRINGAASLGGTGDNNTIGGTTAAKRNVISGSDSYGIWIRGSADNNIVQGNYIGLNAAGTMAIPNSYGVQMHGGSGNVTGGTIGTTPGACTGACNVISGNSTRGIRIDAASNQSVIGNFIGTNPAGTLAIPNLAGIYVQGNNNLIGGSSANARNVVSGNTEDGIVLLGDNNAVAGNYVGLNAAGTASLPNGTGISLGHPDDTLRDALANTVGGLTAQERNIVSGNTVAGIAMHGDAADNTVIGNFIGTNTAGTAAIPNLGSGVYVAEPFNTIGGTEGTTPGGPCTGACNLISGNGTGISFEGSSTTGNEVLGNHVGPDSAGQPLGNGTGVRLENAAGNTIGGADSSAGNVISANSTGVQLSGAETAGNFVLGNLIGTGSDGTTPVGNSFFGVRIADGAHENAIGGTAAGEGNVIAANGTGVRMGDPTTTGNLIQGNFIGTNPAGDASLGNANEGVYISNAAGNTIGGGAAGEGNVVRNNGAAGVRVQDSDAIMNRISGNSIDDNATLGIELNAGANEDQAAPVLASAENGSTHVTGTLDSAPSTQYRVELFDSPACDGSGTGEGRTYLGFGAVTTGIGGSANIDITIPATATAGHVITATATDPGGNTSQFSNCVIVTGSATPTPTPTASPTPTPTSTGATPTPTPTPTASASVTPTPTFAAGLRGDGDCDGDVDLDDVIAALSEFAGVNPGAPCADRADVDCDGDVDGEDALRILLHVAGTPKPPPGGCGPIGGVA